MRIRGPAPLKPRHRRLLLGLVVTLVGLQLVLLAWLWTRPLPERGERPGQGAEGVVGGG